MARRRDDAKAAEAMRLVGDGKTTREVAEILGVDRGTVSRWTAGTRRQGRPASEVDESRLRELAAGGASVREIERETGVPKSVAHRRLGAAGRGESPDPA